MASSEYKASDDKVKFAIDGEMTIYRAEELKEHIRMALSTNRDVEIDLSRVTEIDSAGLQLMLSSKLESIVRSTQLSFVGHSQAVNEVLDMCNLGSFFGDPVVIN